MKTKTVVAIFLAIALVVMAGTNPVTFTGIWNLDKEKSEMGEGGRMGMAALKLTIAQDDKEISIDRFVSSEFRGDYTTTDKVTLDGKETVNSSDFGDRKLTATFSEDGKSLTIKSAMEMNREGETFQINTTEVWTLSDDGAVLKIDQTRTSPRGDRQSILYYNKENIQK
jgi:hypothetical protein